MAQSSWTSAPGSPRRTTPTRWRRRWLRRPASCTSTTIPSCSLLDFHRPIAVILLGLLHLIQDSEDPWAMVGRLMEAVPSGSYLAISHPALEINPGQQEAQKRYNERVSTPQTLRTQSDVARFFTGLELVEPGLVQVHQWRPAAGDPVPDDGASAHGGLARKP